MGRCRLLRDGSIDPILQCNRENTRTTLGKPLPKIGWTVTAQQVVFTPKRLEVNLTEFTRKRLTSWEDPVSVREN